MRAAERDIDDAFRANALAGRDRATCLRAVLGQAEDRIWRGYLGGTQGNDLQQGAETTNVVYDMRIAVEWALKLSEGVAAHPGPIEVTGELYDAAYDLWALVFSYSDFYQALSRGGRGEIRLRLDGSEIIADHRLLGGAPYEVYNHFLEPRGLPSMRLDVADPKHDKVKESIARSTLLDEVEGRFSLVQPQRTVGEVRDAMRGQLAGKFTLPEEWRFSRYSLSEFREAFLVMAALTFMQLQARIFTAPECKARGVDGALFIRSKEWIVRTVTNATSVPEMAVRAIVEDLTYGSRKMREPDPALQPLIPLGDDLMLSPALWLNSAPERNLCVLLNRIPEEKAEYEKLVGFKEPLMAERIGKELSGIGIEPRCRLPSPQTGAPDVDALIVDLRTRLALVVELKWFIAPAEPIETTHRAEDLTKGLRQLRELRTLFESQPALRRSCLGIPEDFEVVYLVASENWIGDGVHQDPDFPIIQLDHLLSKIVAAKDLRAVATWLSGRQYLPVEGKDFEVREVFREVAGWKLRWYGMKPLAPERFLPGIHRKHEDGGTA